MTIHVGTSTEVTVQVRDTDGVLTDPDTLRVILRAPDGTQTEYVFGVDGEITNPSTGVFVFESPALDTAKKWWVGWEATGSGVTVTDETSVEVCGLHVSFASP